MTSTLRTRLIIRLPVWYFFRYVPTDWALKTELTLDEVSDLNTMNIELAGLLGKKNPAFTPFQHGNFSCIMIKEVSSVNAMIDYAVFIVANKSCSPCIHMHSCSQTSMYKSLFLSYLKKPECMKIIRRYDWSVECEDAQASSILI